ncbi:hypothetical protein CROQUDRAFT_87230 [Cronartium quercuum f. sp. fusiforme G11]|uniref:Ataxin-10 homolog n=1 Tax=Cronartium quercuum f. sp. fusiforme G11 TaxID=708437 RepID=A0A9P6TGU7_9BASI|nr:hypothetical protein CROQUDRAFT_87230 [Cronartium quercuum f. sp. fusiforme G11]
MSSIPSFFTAKINFDQVDASSIEESSRELNVREKNCARYEGITQAYEREYIIVSKWVNGAWQWVASKLEDLEDEKDERPILFASALAALTRNLVVGSPALQDGLRPSIELVLKVLWYTSAIVRLEDVRFNLLNLRSTQTLANLLTSNSLSIEHAWPMLTEVDERQSVLLRLTYTKDHKILLTIAVLLINSIHNSPHRTCHPIKLLTQLFERLDELLLVQSPAFELINQDFQTFYQSQQMSSQPVSPSQLVILKVLESSSSTQASALDFLLSRLPLLIQRLVIDRPELEPELSLRLWQAIVLMASTLVKLVEQRDSTEKPRPELQNAVVEVVKASISLLRQMPRNLTTIPLDDEEEGIKKQCERTPATQLRIALLQLLSALCHLDQRIAQDTIRLEGGLGLILGLTVFDSDQPYLREHALFLIRNTLLENLENQMVIREMEKIS